MLSFQLINDGKALQIYCDQHGMASFLQKLATLIGDPDHIHLRGKAAGGNDLDATTPFGESALSEVIVDFRPDYSR